MDLRSITPLLAKKDNTTGVYAGKRRRGRDKKPRVRRKKTEEEKELFQIRKRAKIAARREAQERSKLNSEEEHGEAEDDEENDEGTDEGANTTERDGGPIKNPENHEEEQQGEQVEAEENVDHASMADEGQQEGGEDNNDAAVKKRHKRSKSRQPTEDNPLPSVHIGMIPKMFRLRAGIVMHDFREKVKESFAVERQRRLHATTHKVPYRPLSTSFPWPTLEYTWPIPEFRIGTEDSTSNDNFDPIVEHLLPTFCRLSVFLPDRSMPHLLPNGRMPCKWHGWDNECVQLHNLFATQGPRVIYHEDGSVEYKFSSRYRCTKRVRESSQQKLAQRKKWGSGQIQNEGVQEIATTFKSNEPDIMKQLPTNVQHRYGATLVRKTGISMSLDILSQSLVSEGLSLDGIERSWKTCQLDKFQKALRDTVAMVSNPNFKVTSTKNVASILGKIDTLKLKDVLPPNNFIATVKECLGDKLPENQKLYQTQVEGDDGEFTTCTVEEEQVNDIGVDEGAIEQFMHEHVNQTALEQSVHGVNSYDADDDVQKVAADQSVPFDGSNIDGLEEITHQASSSNPAQGHFTDDKEATTAPTTGRDPNIDSSTTPATAAMVVSDEDRRASMIASRYRIQFVPKGIKKVGNYEKHQKRCLRCGNARKGSHHGLQAAINSMEYCTTPRDLFWPNWIVPQGYELGDQRKKMGIQAIRKQWKQYKHDSGIPMLEPQFPMW